MYKRIKLLREKYNFTIEEISNYLDISPKTYTNIELGKTKVSIIILSKLARKYNTSIDYIIELTDSPIAHKKTEI